MGSLMLLGCGGRGAAGTATVFLGAQVRKAADQTTANYTTRTAIAWDTEVFDSDAFHDAGANTRITIPSIYNGYYVVLFANVSIAATSQNHDLVIFKNGDRNYHGASGFVRNVGAGVEAVGSTSYMQCRTQPIQVATGDFFEVMLRNNSDSSVTITAASSSFSIVVIGNAITGCLVKNSADLTTQNYSAGASIGWNGEVYDPDGAHDLVNTDRITIPAGWNGRYGILKVSTFYSLVADNTICTVGISKNGAATTLDTPNNYTFMGATGAGDLWCEAETPPVLLTTGDIYRAGTFINDTSITVSQYSTFGIEVLPVAFNGALAQLNADATANYSTPTAIAFDGTDVYDTAAAHDPSSNNTKIIIPAAWSGKYGVFNFNTNATAVTASSSASVSIRKGGSVSYNGFGGNGGALGSFTTAEIGGRTGPVLLATGEEYTASYYMSDTSVTLQSEQTSFSLRLLEYV